MAVERGGEDASTPIPKKITSVPLRQHLQSKKLAIASETLILAACISRVAASYLAWVSQQGWRLRSTLPAPRPMHGFDRLAAVLAVWSHSRALIESADWFDLAVVSSAQQPAEIKSDRAKP